MLYGLNKNFLTFDTDDKLTSPSAKLTKIPYGGGGWVSASLVPLRGTLRVSSWPNLPHSFISVVNRGHSNYRRHIKKFVSPLLLQLDVAVQLEQIAMIGLLNSLAQPHN